MYLKRQSFNCKLSFQPVTTQLQSKAWRWTTWSRCCWPLPLVFEILYWARLVCFRLTMIAKMVLRWLSMETRMLSLMEDHRQGEVNASDQKKSEIMFYLSNNFGFTNKNLLSGVCLFLRWSTMSSYNRNEMKWITYH